MRMGKESLTMKDLKSDKIHLEKGIHRLIREFEGKWGVLVVEVNLQHETNMATGEGHTVTVECTVKV